MNIAVEKTWESGGKAITPPEDAVVTVVLGRKKYVEDPTSQGSGTLVINDSYSGLPEGSAYEVAYTITGTEPDTENYSYTFIKLAYIIVYLYFIYISFFFFRINFIIIFIIIE